uniref:Uncharacterized protein n=1 Tax=Opuntia streptacantha TaxID=393608 RepID=A0A7C9D484_OPUST
MADEQQSLSIHPPKGTACYEVAFFRPLFCWLWKLFQVPLGVCSAIGNHAVSFCNDIYEVLEGLLIIILNRVIEICHLATRLSEAKPATTEVSMWNSLWKDLFSKLFRALRSILNGLIAFLDSFNRHRFSTSNQLRKYSRRLSRLLSSGMGGSPLVLSPAEGCQKEVSENHEHID